MSGEDNQEGTREMTDAERRKQQFSQTNIGGAQLAGQQTGGSGSLAPVSGQLPDIRIAISQIGDELQDIEKYMRGVSARVFGGTAPEDKNAAGIAEVKPESALDALNWEVARVHRLIDPIRAAFGPFSNLS